VTSEARPRSSVAISPLSSGIGSIERGKRELGKEANSFSVKEKDWLGGLDSNQDSQIQSLESYQLDDLPADGSFWEVAETRKGTATAAQPF
jgi:hypothetical protein